MFVCDPISTPLPCLCVATMQIEDISSITFTRELYYHLLRGKDVLNVRFHVHRSLMPGRTSPCEAHSKYLFSLIRRSHSVSVTRVQGIPTYNIGLGRG